MLRDICGLKTFPWFVSTTNKHLKCVFPVRQADLETIGSVLQQYRDGHSGLIRWIEETTKKQESTQPEQTDSKALSEQLFQQTVGHSFRDDFFFFFLAGNVFH